MALDRIVYLPRHGLMRRKPNVITRADRARDAGQWELAAGLYRKALDRDPRNSGIWVQYGHSLKESGELRPRQAGASGRRLPEGAVARSRHGRHAPTSRPCSEAPGQD